MTAIPPEVIIPQVCPPEVLIPQVSLLVQKTFSLFVHMVSSGSLTRSLHGHKIGLGLKVGVPEVNFKRGWDCILRFPIKHGSSLNYMGASHNTADTQIRSQLSLHDHNLVTTTALKQHVPSQLSPWRKLTSLEANHVQLHKKGIGWHNIAKSLSWISMTWSISPSFWWQGAHANITKWLRVESPALKDP